MTAPAPGVVAVALVVVATLAIGAYGCGSPGPPATSSSPPARSARPSTPAAIGGEYLSAASFLGVAGLVLAFGADMLWYPVGWTAGYLVLLVLVAAPLRRSGAYTLPDFAESRLGSRAGAPGLLAAGRGDRLALPASRSSRAPGSRCGRGHRRARAGAAACSSAVVVLVNVLFGGMRSITFVQAFQYWLKLTALLVPAAVPARRSGSGDGATGPADRRRGRRDRRGVARRRWPPGGATGLYPTYSIIVATFLGTMGLPHVVVRFYTNPDGRAARRTTLVVLALLGVFYLLPPVYGALGRLYAPDLVAAGGQRHASCSSCPAGWSTGLLGELLSALTAAGAFAAFLSTSSRADDRGGRRARARTCSAGRPGPPAGRGRGVPGRRRGRGRRPAASLALLAEGVGVARAVGLAFAVAASTFCPLLVLGIWWRG